MLILQPDEKNLHPVCLALKLKKLSIILYIISNTLIEVSFWVFARVSNMMPAENQHPKQDISMRKFAEKILTWIHPNCGAAMSGDQSYMYIYINIYIQLYIYTESKAAISTGT